MKTAYLPIDMPAAMDVPSVSLATALALEADDSVYFRVASASADLLNELSVEDAGDAASVIAERLGFDSVPAMKAELDGATHSLWPELQWLETGHYGAGVYYRGVCCAETLGGLAAYALSRCWASPGDLVWVFRGDYVGDCVDGDVVSPTEILGILPIRDLVNVYFTERVAEDRNCVGITSLVVQARVSLCHAMGLHQGILR